MSFTDIKGQLLVVDLLQRSLGTGRLAHTYLFHGPQGVGKQLTALGLAKALNCLEKSDDFCDQCSSCRQITEKRYPDLSILYPIARSRKIKIEQVRQMQRALSWKASSGRFKVAIIIDAHALTTEAANALLKTLEEPPAKSILVLVTHQPEALLPTIRSRAQELQFFNLAPEVLMNILEEQIKLSPKEAALFSQLGRGSVQRALRLQDADISERRRMILDTLAEGSFSSPNTIIERVDKIINSLDQFKGSLQKKIKEQDNELVSREEEEAYIAGEYKAQIEEVLNLVLGWYRDLLIYQHAKEPELLLNRDYIERIVKWSDVYNTDQLCSRINVVDEIKVGLSRNISFKLLLQAMFVKLGM